MTKRAALTELVELTRAAGAPLPSNELPAALYNALLHYFGGIQRARRAAGVPDPPYPKKWTKDQVIAELQRLHRSGLTIRYRDLELCGREDLVGAIRVEIGSIVRARRLAGIPDPPRAWSGQESWDEDRVVEDILALAEAGESLAFSKAPNKLVNAGIRYFGTWEAAITAAGLDYDAIRLRRKPYDDDTMLERIRELAREHPRMTLGELWDHPDGQAIARRFSSIEDAAARAGVVGWPIRVLQDAPTEADVTHRLRARRRAKRELTKTAIETEDPRLRRGIQRHYGTMESALTAAGLPVEKPSRIRWTPDEVLRQLQRRRDEGKPLDAASVRAAMPVLYERANKFFGSYMSVASRFGVKPRQRSWTREVVLDEIRKLAKRKNVVKSTDAADGLLNACWRYFGTFEAARAAAGVRGPDQHPRGTWTRERVIEVLRERARSGESLSGNTMSKALLAACWRQFGGLDAALAAASIRR